MVRVGVWVWVDVGCRCGCGLQCRVGPSECGGGSGGGGGCGVMACILYVLRVHVWFHVRVCCALHDPRVAVSLAIISSPSIYTVCFSMYMCILGVSGCIDLLSREECVAHLHWH